MFSGNFAQISFSEVLKLLAAAGQTGELVVDHEGAGLGSVFLLGGEMVHAHFGAAQGLDALSEICVHTAATFRFHAGATSPVQSLAGMPTRKLIETIATRIAQIRTVEQFAPAPGDVIRYRAGASLESLQATPDELALLLMADGLRTVEQISLSAGRTVDEVRQALAGFRQAGLIDVVSPVPPVAPPAPAIPQDGAPPSVPPRFWRGKRIE